MPVLDSCHPQIVRALRKEGWRVEDKPRALRVNRRRVLVDVSASRITNTGVREILLAEVKCLSESSTTQELYTAIGQYLVYRTMLDQLEIRVPLYLAVPEAGYLSLFDSTIRQLVDDNRIKLVIVNLVTETIVAWKE
jgi:hypothetical protein